MVSCGFLRTGAQWADLPERYPPYQTCHRRFQRWVRDETLERVLAALARDRKGRGKLDLSECFIERAIAWIGTFRRLVVRYERHALDVLGFVHLGCVLISLRQGW